PFESVSWVKPLKPGGRLLARKQQKLCNFLHTAMQEVAQSLSSHKRQGSQQSMHSFSRSCPQKGCTTAFGLRD
ncbi:hypothetical protein NOX75_14325, partial [Pseudomonas aeruginosa]|uniref:hypothetical protein n=1 Tax=Pseudomonas aeruginosa TaxID=287 RepID=UPI00210BFA7A